MQFPRGGAVSFEWAFTTIAKSLNDKTRHLSINKYQRAFFKNLCYKFSNSANVLLQTGTREMDRSHPDLNRPDQRSAQGHVGGGRLARFSATAFILLAMLLLTTSLIHACPGQTASMAKTSIAGLATY